MAYNQKKKKKHGEKGQIFVTEEFQIINVEGMRETELQHNNCYKQDPLMIKFKEKQVICVASKCLPQNVSGFLWWFYTG